MVAIAMELGKIHYLFYFFLLFYCFEYKANISLLQLLAKLKLIESLIQLRLFPSLITIPFQKRGFQNSIGSMGAAFLNKSKVAISEEFSWGMSRISKGEGCQKWGIKCNRDKISLPTVKSALNCQNLNHLIGVLFLINLINSLTFAYLGGLKHTLFRSRIWGNTQCIT